jgi:hypothetical protein
MPRRLRDILIALAVVGACVWGIVAQFDSCASPASAYGDVQPVAFGSVLQVDFPLFDIQDPPKPRNLMGLYGRKATVLYSWSVACPCVAWLEKRMHALWERHGKDDPGIRWIALAGEPGESLAALRRKHEHLHAFYPVLRDPNQLVLRRLAIRHAGQVAVLDGQGRLIYRGAMDDDLAKGKAEHLQAVLEAVLAGRPVAIHSRPRIYGCPFNLPPSCPDGPPPDDKDP